MKANVKKQLNAWKKLVDGALKKCLSVKSSGFTDEINAAMKYSVFSGGKRIRPILAIASANACGMKVSGMLPAACAIELIHTYSLIHDDLPCMDNSDYRRGKPTLHKKFNEGIAVLAGDALLTKAFELIAGEANTGTVTAQKAVKVIEIMSKAIGPEGMIAGQVADTFLDYGKLNRVRRISLINYIHTHKTGDLIEASVNAGAVLAGADKRKMDVMGRYGRIIGFVFQIVDDIFDEDENRLTYPSLFGKGCSKEKALKLIQAAKKELRIFADKAVVLNELADYVVQRKK